MSLLGAWILVLGFLLLLIVLRIGTSVGAMLGASKSSLAIVRDKALTDAQKEKQIQALSIQTFKASFVTLGKLLVAFLVPFGLVYALGQAGVWSAEEVLDRSLGWDVIVGATVVGLVLARLLSKAPRSEPA